MKSLRFLFATLVLFTCVFALDRASQAYPPWNGTGLVSVWNITPATPTLNPTWGVTAWWIDPVSGSDSNTGKSSGSPFKTWHHLNDQVWGCMGSPRACPRLRQNTTITFLSSQSGTTDPIYFFPAYENGPIEVQLTGQLGASQQKCTGTLSGVVAKNRTTPQLLNATLCASLSPGTLIVNTTHPSKSWTYSLVSGTTWAMTQPLTTPTFGAGFAAEVDTWANGDSYTAYTPTGINLAGFEPTLGDLGSSPNDTGLIQDLEILDPWGSGQTLAMLGNLVDVTEVFSQRIIVAATADGASMPFVSYYQNVFAQSGMSGGFAYTPGLPGFAVFPTVIGGAIGTPGSPTLNIDKLAGVSLDNDVILKQTFASTPVNIGSARLGLVYIDSSSVATCAGACNGLSGGTASASTIVWGPGTFNAAGASRVSYPAGAGAGAAAFKVTLNENGQAKACVVAPGAASGFGTCNLTLSGSQLDTSLGATTGCLSTGPASFCNYGD